MFEVVSEFITNTQVIEQLQDQEFRALYKNWYFIVPVAIFYCCKIFRGSFKAPVILTVMLIGGFFIDTEFCRSATINGEMQLDHVLPIVGGIFVGLLVILYAATQLE